jgi:hypothetical protein
MAAGGSPLSGERAFIDRVSRWGTSENAIFPGHARIEKSHRNKLRMVRAQRILGTCSAP